MNKFQKIITKDLGWKLLSVAIASIMWFLVININQPIDTRTYYKKVALTNAQAITAEGLAIAEIQDILDTTVSIKVKAQRTALDRLANSMNDLTATIDLSALQVVTAGETVSLPIDVHFGGTAGDTTYTVLSQSPSNLSIKIDGVVEEQRSIEVEISGVVEEEGMFSSPQLSDEVASVKGASSSVAKVDKVYGVIDGGAVSKDGYERITLKAITETGEVIEDVEINPSSVLVSFYEMATKNIPIYVSVTGKPSSSFKQGEVVLKPEYVNIIGEVQLVEAVDFIQLESISVSGATSNVSKMYDIKGYLPEGVYLSSGQSQYVNVIVPLLGNEVREIKFSFEQLETIGEDENYIYFLEEYATTNVAGQKSELDALNISEIKGKIDVTGLSVGEYTLDISFTNPNLLLNSSGYINVIVEKNNSLNSDTTDDSDILDDVEQEVTDDETVQDETLEDDNSTEALVPEVEEELDEDIENDENNEIEKVPAPLPPPPANLPNDAFVDDEEEVEDVFKEDELIEGLTEDSTEDSNKDSNKDFDDDFNEETLE